MFEKKHHDVLPPSRFARRMALFIAVAGGIMLTALALGVAGYRWIAGLNWIDSLLSASMILTGMGPVAPMTTTAAKLFASAYALFSAMVFVAVTGVVLAPIAHRVLHKFHVDEDDEDRTA